MAKRDNHKAARALADWAQHGFTRATENKIADTYGINTRTLWRWKDALDDDNELSALFRARLNDALDQDWASHLGEALVELIQRIRELADQPDTPLRDVTEAFRALSEVAITREVLRGAADAQPHRGYEAPSREAPASNATNLTN